MAKLSPPEKMTTNYHTISSKVKLYMSKTPEHKHKLKITIIKAQPTLRPASLLWRFISCLRGRDVIDLGKKYNLTFRSRVISSDGAISRSARYVCNSGEGA